MPNIGLWYRQQIRRFKRQSPETQMRTGIGVAVVLLVVVAVAGLGLVNPDASREADLVQADRRPPTDAPNQEVGSSTTQAALGDAGGAGSGGSAGGGPTATPKSSRSLVQPGAVGGPGGRPIDRVLNLDCARKCETGVTSEKVKVAFPWFDLSETCNLSGTCAEVESGEKAIKKYVAYYNKNGGLAGRQIDPVIERFNPLNDASMTELCKRWAQDDKVFAVVDSEAWHSRHQLCLTEQYKIPLVSSLTNVEEWATKRGNPYLWWTGPSTDDTIENWVSWTKQRGLVGGKNQIIGVAVSDRAEDIIAAKLMKAALARVGITDALFETIPFDNAQAQAALPLAINRMKSYKGTGVTHLFGTLPFTTFAFWLNQAEQQQFFPRYLLSDLSQGLVVAEALLGSQFPDSLHTAIGPTYTHLGEGTGGKSPYSQAEKECDAIWRSGDAGAAHLFHAGVAMRWCTNIGVFAEAARRATVNSGGLLTRLNFGEAMGTIVDMPTGMAPVLSWAPGDYAGAKVAKIVEVRTKGPNNKPCTDGTSDDDGVCHVEVEPFSPLRKLG